ncbi:MAG: hypothetical protein EOO28_28240 [Comamonadaceae bacterium]|nr:MAG: hypothetical protein EOO28_28240 [Comamonadaceae bacterium]
MIFSWLNAKDEKAFGESLALFFAQRIPADSDFKAKKFAAKAQQVLASMGLQVDKFKKDRKLNVFKKAQLGNAFKWKLRDAGYEQSYVDELTEWLMLRI